MGSTGGVSQLEYLQQANDSLLTIVQIETKEALENVRAVYIYISFLPLLLLTELRQAEEIAQVPGIDVLFVGPWDLGNNIGRPVMGTFHPDLSAAIERVRKAATAHGKRAGIYCVGGEAAKKFADQGFHMVRIMLSLETLPVAMLYMLIDENMTTTPLCFLIFLILFLVFLDLCCCRRRSTSYISFRAIGDRQTRCCTNILTRTQICYLSLSNSR